MKKIALFSALFAAASSFAQSSLVVINMAGATVVTPNDTIFESVDASTNVKTTLNIKNNSGTSKTYNAKRYDMLLNAQTSFTAEAYFCFGGNCYGSGTTVSPNALTLGAAQSASSVPGSYNMLVADLDEAEVKGKSWVKYTFFNTDPNNKADSIQISIKYNYKASTPVGLKDQNLAVSGFEIAPNPAKSAAFISVNAVKSSEATIRIYNSLGALVSVEQANLSEGKNKIELNTASLVSGIYFVTFENNNATITKRLIID